jgi:uncharacterized membrane protein YdjX (TVP38/TMEM64 family)
MTGGYVTGGWPFVIAAYSWTAIVLTSYAISLFVRQRKSR